MVVLLFGGEFLFSDSGVDIVVCLQFQHRRRWRWRWRREAKVEVEERGQCVVGGEIHKWSS
jgi:hypothetical protein